MGLRIDYSQMTGEQILSIFQNGKDRQARLKGKPKGYYPYKPGDDEDEDKKKGKKYPYPGTEKTTVRYEMPTVLFCAKCKKITKYSDKTTTCPDCGSKDLYAGFALKSDGSKFEIEEDLSFTEVTEVDAGEYIFYDFANPDSDESILVLPLVYWEGNDSSDDAKEEEEEKEKDEEKKFELEVEDVKNFPIFTTGSHNGDEYTEADLDEIAKNFMVLRDLVQPPLKFGHLDQKKILPKGMPAIGWVTSVRKKGRELLADISQIPKRVADIIKAGGYRRPSAEIYVNYTDSSGKQFGKALAAVSLLGADIPAVKELGPLKLDALEKLYADNFGRNETRTYGGVDDMGLPADRLAELEKELAAIKDDLKAKETKLLEQDNVLKEKDKALVEAATEKKKLGIVKFLDDAAQEGKIIPRIRPVLEILLMNVNDSEIVSFSEKIDENNEKKTEGSSFAMIKELVTRLPKLVAFDEQSNSGKDLQDEFDTDKMKKTYAVDDKKGEVLDGVDVHKLVLQYMKDKNVSYSDALVKVYAEKKIPVA